MRRSATRMRCTADRAAVHLRRCLLRLGRLPRRDRRRAVTECLHEHAPLH
jgi:hypothetical protein